MLRQFILDQRRELQWTYGPVSSFLYPLEEVDWERGASMGCLEWIVDNGHKVKKTKKKKKKKKKKNAIICLPFFFFFFRVRL